MPHRERECVAKHCQRADISPAAAVADGTRGEPIARPAMTKACGTAATLISLLPSGPIGAACHARLVKPRSSHLAISSTRARSSTSTGRFAMLADHDFGQHHVHMASIQARHQRGARTVDAPALCKTCRPGPNYLIVFSP